MSRNTLFALGGGAASAVLYLLIPLGGLFAALPLLLAGLAFGTRAGTIACLAGFIGVSALAGPFVGGVYAVLYGIPSLIVVRQVLMHRAGSAGTQEWYSVGGIVSWLSAMGMALLILAAAAAGSSGDGLQAMTTQQLDIVISQMPQLNDDTRDMLVNVLVPVLPGLACAMMLLITLLNGVLAQTILVRQGRNLRPAGSFDDVAVPDWMSWLLVVPAALSLVGTGEVRYMGHNLAVIAVLPFFLVGLSLVHQLARRAQFPGLILTVFYVILAAFSTAAIFVAALGVIDQWFGLRDQLDGPSNDRENE